MRGPQGLAPGGLSEGGRFSVPTITALERQKKNPRRVNVYLDGHFALGLEGVLAARLRVGQTITQADLARLQDQDTLERATALALEFLARRPRSEAEVRQRLSKKGFAPPVVEEVLARLRELALLDDEAFVRFWVENRSQFRPRGIQGLRYELRQKGVPAETVDQALEQIDEEELIWSVARTRARRLLAAPIDSHEFQRKLGGFLLRQGFDPALTREIVGQLWREHQDRARGEH